MNCEVHHIRRIFATWALCLAFGVLALSVTKGQPAQDESPATIQYEFAQGLFQSKLYRSAAAEYEKFSTNYPKDLRVPEILYRLGQCHYLLKEYAAAATTFGKLVNQFPESELRGRALLERGNCLILADSVREGIEDLKQFLTLSPKPQQAVVAKYLMGKGYRRLGDEETAEVTFTDVVERGPEESDYRAKSLSQLVEINKSTNPEAALVHARRIVREFAGNPLALEAQLKIGRLLMVLENHKEAEKAFLQVPEGSSLRPTALMDASSALHAQKKYDQAIVLCQQILDNFPKNSIAPVAFYQIGVCQMADQKHEEAAATFERLANGFPEHEYGEKGAAGVVRALYNMGEEKADRILASGFAYKGRYPKGPSLGIIHFFLGEALMWQKQYDRAIEQYSSVPEGNPVFEEAAFHVAIAHEFAKRHQEAAVAYDAFVEAHPEHARAVEALFNAGVAYQNLKAYNDAKTCYARLRELFAGHALAARALFETAMCDYLLNDLASTKQALNKYLETYREDEDAGAAYFWLGRIAQAEEDFDRATEFYRRSAALPGPRQAEAKLQVAQSLFRGGREAEAVREFLLLITVGDNPINEEAYVYVGKYCQANDNLPKAIFAYKKLLEDYPKTTWRDDALYMLGVLYAELPEPDWTTSSQYFTELIELYDTSLEKDPKANTDFLFPAKLELGSVLVQMHKEDEARPLLENVWKNADNQRTKFQAQLALASLDLNAKDYSKAKDLFLQIGILYDDPALAPEALYKAALCLELLGDNEESSRLQEELNERYPDSSWAKKTQLRSQDHTQKTLMD